jgi:hypothetical protein
MKDTGKKKDIFCDLYYLRYGQVKSYISFYIGLPLCETRLEFTMSKVRSDQDECRRNKTVATRTRID